MPPTSSVPRLLLFLLVAFVVSVVDAPPAMAGKPVCGDGKCSGGETPASCPADCATSSSCGDGTCDAGEDCASCEADCGSCGGSCGCNFDGVCNLTEDCSNCPSDCASSGKGKNRVCCGQTTSDPAVCGEGAGTPHPDSDGDGVLDCDDGCPADPFKVEPGERGCGLEEPARATVVAGEATFLYVTGGTLVIPADTIEAGTDVTLLVTPPVLSAFPGTDFPDEVPLTDVYSIEFSSSQWTDVAISLYVDIALPAPAGFFGRTSAQGGIAGEGDAGWVLDVGEYSSSTAQLRFPITSTASEITVAVLTSASADPGDPGNLPPPPADPTPVPPDPSDPLGSLDPDKYRVNQWQQFGWAVACRTELPECTRDNVDALARRFDNSVDLIRSHVDSRFTTVRIRTVTKAEIERAAKAGIRFGVYDPAHPSFDELPDDHFYMLAGLVANGSLDFDGRSVLGTYSAGGSVHVIASVLNETLDPGTADTVVHELFHAVQGWEIPNVRSKWIREGTAKTAEMATNLLDSEGRMDFRFGPWRNWEHPVKSTEGTDHYKIAELFFFHAEGAVTYLHGFFTALKANQPTVVNDTNSYDKSDAALGGQLDERYLELIKKRSGEAYPDDYVAYEVCEVGTTCVGADYIPLLPMAAMKIDLLIESAPPSCASGEAVVINSISRSVTLVVNEGNASTLKLLLGTGESATYVAPGTFVELANDNPTIWVVNHDKNPSNSALFSFVATRDVDFSCGICGDGVVGAGEECDDGNIADGDGCSAECVEELACTGECVEEYVSPVTINCEDGFCTCEGSPYGYGVFKCGTAKCVGVRCPEAISLSCSLGPRAQTLGMSCDVSPCAAGEVVCKSGVGDLCCPLETGGCYMLDGVPTCGTGG